MNMKEKLFESKRIKYGLKNYQEIIRLRNDNKLKAGLIDIIKFAVNEVINTHLYDQLIYIKQPELIEQYIYYYIIKYYMCEMHPKTTITKFINDTYNKNTLGLVRTNKSTKKIENKDTYVRRVTRYFHELYEINNQLAYEFFITRENKKNQTYDFVGNKIADWDINRVQIYLKMIEEPTFKAIWENRYTDIKFRQYAKLVKKLRANIMCSDNDYKNIMLYNMEYFLNFEFIKYLCKQVHDEQEKMCSKYDKEELHDIGKKLVDNLIIFKDIPDLSVRHLYVEVYKIVNKNLTKEEIDYLNSKFVDFYRTVVEYVLYICKNVFDEQIRKQISMGLKENKEYIFMMPYINSYKFNCDFTEMDFAIVMEGFQDAFTIKFNIDSIFARLEYKVAKEYGKNHDISTISKNNNLPPNTIQELIDNYKEWQNEYINTESIYSSLCEYYNPELYSIDECNKNRQANKIFKSMHNGLSISEISKKYKIQEKTIEIFENICFIYKKIINPKFITRVIMDEYIKSIKKDMNERNLSERIEEYVYAGFSVLEIEKRCEATFKKINGDKKFDILDYYDRFGRYIEAEYNSGLDKTKIMEKYNSEEEDYNYFITKKVIWLKLRDYHRAYPDKGLSQLASEFGINRKTVKKYISSNCPPKYSKRKNAACKLLDRDKS